MKVIKQGGELELYKENGWWVGLTIECNACKSEFILTWEDRKNVKAGYQPTRHGRGGFGEVEAKCQFCEETMSATISREEFHERIALTKDATEIPVFL